MIREGRDDVLAKTDWLEKHTNDPAVRIVDIRGIVNPPDAPRPYEPNLAAYMSGHIPGAVLLDWTTDIIDTDSPVRMAMAGPEKFKSSMERLGIGNQHTVVVYDDAGFLAPRLWWMMKYFGHDAVKVLDGGWQKWIAEGRPVSQKVPSHQPATFTPSIRQEMIIREQEVRSLLHKPEAALIDCRDVNTYAGRQTRGRRPGRLPGAINIPWNSFLNKDGTWMEAPEMQDIARNAGLRPNQKAVTYCNAGVVSSTIFLGLHMLGHGPVANYVGSWYEWETNPNNPIEVDA